MGCGGTAPFARTGYRKTTTSSHSGSQDRVLEDSGWNTHQFHAATEFYSDYGLYDVRITVPERFVVGASGREVERMENANGTVTHRYEAEDIHDFAWTASPNFLEDTRAFEHPTLPRVNMRLLLQPEHAGQESRHFDATAAALKYYGEWFGAYPYDPHHHHRSCLPKWQWRHGVPHALHLWFAMARPGARGTTRAGHYP